MKNKNILEKITNKLSIINEKTFGLNPFIYDYYSRLKGNEIKENYNYVYNKVRNNKKIINELQTVFQLNNLDENTNDVLIEKIKDLKYENGTSKLILKLLRKRGDFKMNEYLINVKTNKEKGYYIEAESNSEALKLALEYFINEDEESEINPTNLTLEIVSMSEIEEDELEDFSDEDDNEIEDELSNLSYNIQISPIKNSKELKKTDKNNNKE